MSGVRTQVVILTKGYIVLNIMLKLKSTYLIRFRSHRSLVGIRGDGVVQSLAQTSRIKRYMKQLFLWRLPVQE